MSSTIVDDVNLRHAFRRILWRVGAQPARMACQPKLTPGRVSEGW
jgi:hypothetical protein